MTNSNYHESVMTEEVIDSLHIDKDCKPACRRGKYIDATLGTGGHSLAIVEAGGTVLGIEMDPKMLSIAQNRLEKETKDREKYKLVHGNFSNIDKIAKENGWNKVCGVVFDLGVTNLHLTGGDRGFSFSNSNLESHLDMRIDPETNSIKGWELLNVLREDQLRKLFEVTLNPGAAMWLSKKIVKFRATNPIMTVGDFINACQGLKTDKVGLNPATLPFLAVRIAVNSELTNLEEALPKAFELLAPGGRLTVISFHSKEDVIVKDFFKQLIADGSAKAITYKPIIPSEKEVDINRRSRSAKLRVVERV